MSLSTMGLSVGSLTRTAPFPYVVTFHLYGDGRPAWWQAAKVDSALRTLTQLSRSIAFYDTAVVMSRSADAELLDKVPKLENFATITSADLIDAAGRMVTVCREQAANERQAAKEAVAPETLLAVDAASQDHTLT